MVGLHELSFTFTLFVMWVIFTKKMFCSLAISKNTNHFSKILLAWNDARYQFKVVRVVFLSSNL